MALNLKQKLFISAVNAAAEVDPALDLKEAMAAAFKTAAFDPTDFDFWKHCFIGCKAQLDHYSKFLALSETPAPKPKVKPPVPAAPAA